MNSNIQAQHSIQVITVIRSLRFSFLYHRFILKCLAQMENIVKVWNDRDFVFNRRYLGKLKIDWRVLCIFMMMSTTKDVDDWKYSFVLRWPKLCVWPINSWVILYCIRIRCDAKNQWSINLLHESRVTRTFGHMLWADMFERLQNNFIIFNLMTKMNKLLAYLLSELDYNILLNYYDFQIHQEIFFFFFEVIARILIFEDAETKAKANVKEANRNRNNLLK